MEIRRDSSVSSRNQDTAELIALIKEQDLCRPPDNFSQTAKKLSYTYAKKEKEKNERLIPKTPKIELPPLPLQAEYISVAKWKLDLNYPRVQNAFVRVAKYVILRENLLLRIEGILTRVDEKYWRYAALRVNRADLHIEHDSAELERLKATIFSLQGELCVAIAHLRSVSLALVSNVMKWRRTCGREIDRKETPSVHWHGENYFIKMLSDTCKLFDVPMMWMWLGFRPNVFMIPPHECNPLSARAERDLLKKDWLMREEAFKREQLQKVALLSKPNTATSASIGSPMAAAASMLQRRKSTPSQKGPSEASASQKNTVDASDDDAMLAGKVVPITIASQESMPLPDDDTSVGESKSILSGESSVAGDDWSELKAICLTSWEPSDSEPNAFWSNLYQKHEVIDAAVGYLDVFPRMYIVPPLGFNLIERCDAMELILHREVALVESMLSAAEQCSLLREQTLKELFMKPPEQALANSTTDLLTLRRRQQSVIRMSSSLNQLRTSQPVEEILSPDYANDYSGLSVFLTTGKSEFPSNTASILKINKQTRVLEAVNKVDDSRKCVNRINYLISLRRNRKKNSKDRTLMKMSKRLNGHTAAAKIQAVMRGVLAREKIKRQKLALKRLFAVLLLQRVVRGYIGKLRAAQAKRRYRLECLIMRKVILRKKHGADVIGNFMLFCLATLRRNKLIKKYASLSKAFRSPQAQRMWNAIVDIQKVFRGYQARKRVKRLRRTLTRRYHQKRSGFMYSSASIRSDDDPASSLASVSKLKLRTKYNANASLQSLEHSSVSNQVRPPKPRAIALTSHRGRAFLVEERREPVRSTNDFYKPPTKSHTWRNRENVYKAAEERNKRNLDNFLVSAFLEYEGSDGGFDS